MVRDLIIFKRCKVLIRALIAALVPLLFTVSASADVLDVPAPPAAHAGVPETGLTMQQVLNRWGEPNVRHVVVSSPGTAQRPPINRWDYSSFSVVFERDRVIHTVHPQHPPTVVAPVQ